MAEENTQTEGGTSEERPDTGALEQEARGMGWLPKDQFRGDPGRWVDAENYVRKGKEFIPILQSQLRERDNRLSDMQQRLEAAERVNRANSTMLEGIQETQARQTTEQLETERESLGAEIAAAREADDVQQELRLRDRRDEIVEQIKTAKKEKPTNGAEASSSPTPPNFENHPDWRQFITENPWFREDPVMAAASTVLGQQLALRGELKDLTPIERFRKIAAATKEKFGVAGNSNRQRQPRVASGGGGADNSGDNSGGERKQRFEDLPVEARTACDRMAKKMVGAGRKYKDTASYRQQYADTYFNS